MKTKSGIRAECKLSCVWKQSLLLTDTHVCGIAYALSYPDIFINPPSLGVDVSAFTLMHSYALDIVFHIFCY